MDKHYVYRPLLDLLGRSEGTDKGRGYNETLGYGAFTGGDVRLTGMTLTDIDILQGQMLAHPGNKWNSSALGRYQIVRTTLRKIKAALKWPNNKKFDADAQDHAARYLMYIRGIDRYNEGKLKEDKMLLNLAKEWASIPKADGFGYYSNQKRTPVTPSEVRAVLKEVRNRYNGNVKQEHADGEADKGIFHWIIALLSILFGGKK